MNTAQITNDHVPNDALRTSLRDDVISSLMLVKFNSFTLLGSLQDTVTAYLNKLIDWGVAGFRVDASKHMFVDDMDAMFSRLHTLNEQWFEPGTTPFIFMEVIDMGGEPIKAADYIHMGRVTEFKHCKNLGDVVRKNHGQHLGTPLHCLPSSFKIC